MIRACILVLFFAGCRAERPATATIPPAEGRPAPTPTAMMPEGPMITTSGSPPPAGALAPGTQFVTVSRTGISMRELIPRGHTVFHVMNETSVAHELILRSASGTTLPAPLPPAARSVLQARLTDRAYALLCATPGHAEGAEFSTYLPGSTPLR